MQLTDMSTACFSEKQSMHMLNKKHKHSSKCRDVQLGLNVLSCLQSAQLLQDIRFPFQELWTFSKLPERPHQLAFNSVIELVIETLCVSRKQLL